MTEEELLSTLKGLMQGAGEYVLNRNGTQDICSWKSNLNEPLSDDFITLRNLTNPVEKSKLVEKMLKNYSPPLSSVIIFPKNLEVGKTYYIHFLAGTLFNPDDGFLKPLAIYNEIKRDPGLKLKDISVKLSIPEDKITVNYGDIRIQEIWNEKMTAVDMNMEQFFEDYYMTNKYSTEYFNKVARDFYLQQLPKTNAPLLDSHLGKWSESYLGQMKLKEAAAELESQFLSLATLGFSTIGGNFKSLIEYDLYDFSGNKKRKEEFLKLLEAANTTYEVLVAVMGFCNDEFGSVSPDLMINSYDDNRYDVVNVNWDDDSLLLREHFLNERKNNVMISIPITVDKALEPDEIVGSYIHVVYEDEVFGEKEMSQYFPWENGVSQGLFEGDVEPGMVLIPSGTFEMGSEDGDSDERPVHEVRLTYDYWMGKYEVTNGEYIEFLNSVGVDSDGEKNGIEYIDINSSYCDIEYRNGRFMLKERGKTNYPMIEVTWYGAVAYCNWLSWQKGLPEAYEWDSNQNTYKLRDYPNNKGYRLPTEAEWEYAARGGENYKYAGSNDLDEVGWYWDNSENPRYALSSGKGTQEVGQKRANGYGLYDMSGNVWEWCQDYWDRDYYDKSPSNNPVNFVSSSIRVKRGGRWNSNAVHCRVAYRNSYSPTNRSHYLGFRIARSK